MDLTLHFDTDACKLLTLPADSNLHGLCVTTVLLCRDDELAHYHANNREMVKQVSSLTSQINQLQNSLDDEMTRVDELQKLQRDFAFRYHSNSDLVGSKPLSSDTSIAWEARSTCVVTGKVRALKRTTV